MTIEYAHEKLTEAVYVLATGASRIQERLADAALCFVGIRPEYHFPDEESRRTYLGIRDDLAKLGGADDENASAIARRIVGLYHEIDQLMGD